MKNKTDKSKLMQRLLSLLKMERKFNYFTLEINEILASSRKELLYSKLLELFINLNFGEDEAKKHWKNIIKNIDFMKNHLNREIGLRVAIGCHRLHPQGCPRPS